MTTKQNNPLLLPWRSVGDSFHGYGIVNCDWVLQGSERSLNEMQKDAILAGVNSQPDLLAAMESILQTCEAGVIHRSETGKPPWSAFEHIKSIASAALTKAKCRV